MREYKLLFDNDCQAAAKFLPEKRVITAGASLFLAKVEANDQEGLHALGRKEILKFNSASRHSVRKKVSSLTAARGLLSFPLSDLSETVTKLLSRTSPYKSCERHIEPLRQEHHAREPYQGPRCKIREHPRLKAR